MVYLDWASTARPDEACMAEALRRGQEAFGNPSSLHAAGKKARELLESSRATLAGVVGCAPGEIVVTSGGTESNWIAVSSVLSRLRPTAEARRTLSVVATGIEHSSVHDNLETLRGFGVRVTLVPAGRSGAVRAEDIVGRLDGDTVMVLVMAVNNVTGAIQPVPEIAAAVAGYAAEHGRRIVLHTDAVQALGKIPLDLAALGADSASFSAHKIGGPRGIGALYVRTGAPMEPLARGEQEHGLRGGTENCVGAAAFALVATARKASFEQVSKRAGRLAALAHEALGRIPGCVFLPYDRFQSHDGSPFSPFIVSAAFPPIPSDVLVRVLGAEGICVSSGSACASRSKEKRERVYRAMEVSAAHSSSAIRISTGPETTEEEIRRLAEVLDREVPRMARIAGSQPRVENHELRTKG
jgi:cysteine desulfurase